VARISRFSEERERPTGSVSKPEQKEETLSEVRGCNRPMPDYFLTEHFAAKLGLSREELADFEAKRVIRRVVKNERMYYSSRDFYRLRAVLHLVHDKGLSVEEARFRVDGAARPIAVGDR
jgi:hypothetical protein